MGAWVSSESGQRFLRHLPEVIAVIVTVSLLGATGFVVGVPLWVFFVLLFAATGLISMAYSQWGADCNDRDLRKRIALQTVCVGTLAYATGWGPALGMVHLFTLADNTRHSGSRAISPVVASAMGATLLGQIAVTVGTVGSTLDVRAAHGIAIIGMLIFGFVAGRVARMTRDKESAERSVRASEERFRSLVSHSSDVIVTVGGNGRMGYVSPSALSVLGYADETLLELKYLDLIHPDDLEATSAFVETLLVEPGSRGVTECRLRHKQGQWLTVETACQNLLDEPGVAAFVLNVRDISDRKDLEQKLEHRAFHDTLTGLANRALFVDRVDHVRARGARNNQTFGVLFLDLDGFKNINDSLGHQAGDQLLVEVGVRLRDALRDVDTAARFGGDEFAILVEDLNDQSDAARVAERVLTSLRRPIVVGDTEVTIDGSIGIAICTGTEDADTILRNADIAMYMAKGAGKGRYEIFEPRMHLAVVERLELERDLARAVELDQLVLHYQPIVGLEDGKIKGVEALVRWNHPVRGMVAPNDFIPLAEETGLVVPLGTWVLNKACHQVRSWQQLYPQNPPLTVAVNVAAKQLANGKLRAEVAQALRDSGLPAHCLTLEITETAIIVDPEDTIRQLKELKSLGVRIAIDDFGTGYSSLAYLQRFPIDVLKIDRSFIDGMTNGKQNPAVVRAIVNLGHSLDLQTVAEGIEHGEQLTQFKALNCQLGQGYLFARPADNETIGQLLSDRQGPTVVIDVTDTAVAGAKKV